ncbi:MAG: hypothetical protein U9Q74_15225 [Gemmatimonadota bacterium]|nr:hypothetical protein [Gemmatimonadota bacterium]
MRRTLRTIIVASVVAAAAGCYYLAGPVPGVIYVSIGPPVPPTEVILASPGPRYVWRPGHWRWDARTYVWVPGVWVETASGYHTWVPGRWAHDRHGWYWIEGHWR